MIEVVPLLLAAAVVGILHMSAPDHWVTLCILGRASGWANGRLFGVTLITGVGHVVLSIALGLVVVVVGLVFSNLVSLYFALAVGFIMVGVGLFVGVRSLLSREQKLDVASVAANEKKQIQKGAGYFAALGAALSPDLSIVPIFLIAAPVGLGLAVDTAIVFAAASILTIVLLVMLGSAGLARAFERIPPKYNDALVGFVIAAVGAYIVVFG